MDDLRRLLEKIDDKVDKMSESQIRVEDDLRYHIKRTDLLENRIDTELTPLHRAYIGVKWTVGLIIGAGAVVAALAKLKGW
jgi:phosphoglycerate-specific signal transduction histidine kinase